MNMIKKTLSEIDIYTGDVNLPKGIEINLEALRADILFYLTNNKFPQSKSTDILDTYIRDYFNVNFKRYLIQRHTTGIMLKPNEYSLSLYEVNPMDLVNSVDYVMFYGVNIHNEGSCKIVFEYDNKRFKDNFYEISLKTNSYVIFPSTLVYRFEPNTSSSLNYIMKTTYELK